MRAHVGPLRSSAARMPSCHPGSLQIAALSLRCEQPMTPNPVAPKRAHRCGMLCTYDPLCTHLAIAPYLPDSGMNLPPLPLHLPHTPASSIKVSLLVQQMRPPGSRESISTQLRNWVSGLYMCPNPGLPPGHICVNIQVITPSNVVTGPHQVASVRNPTRRWRTRPARSLS